MVIFVAVGVILSAIGIGSGALLDRSFLFPVDVVNLTGLRVLASVPYVKMASDIKQRKKKAAENAKIDRKSTPSSYMTSSPNGNAEVDSPERQVS
jgi:hypothetical protein